MRKVVFMAHPLLLNLSSRLWPVGKLWLPQFDLPLRGRKLLRQVPGPPLSRTSGERGGHSAGRDLPDELSPRSSWDSWNTHSGPGQAGRFWAPAAPQTVSSRRALQTPAGIAARAGEGHGRERLRLNSGNAGIARGRISSGHFQFPRSRRQSSRSPWSRSAIRNSIVQALCPESVSCRPGSLGVSWPARLGTVPGRNGST